MEEQGERPPKVWVTYVLPKGGAGMTMIKDGVYRALGFEITLRCDAIKLLLLTDGYPPEPTQHYVYSSPSSMAWQNTRQIFLAAGIPVNSFEDLVARGILWPPVWTPPSPRR